MIFDENDFKVFDDMGNALKTLMDKLEQQTKDIDSEEKGFMLSSISSVKEKIKNGGDLTTEIEKIKNYASNR